MLVDATSFGYGSLDLSSTGIYVTAYVDINEVKSEMFLRGITFSTEMKSRIMQHNAWVTEHLQRVWFVPDRHAVCCFKTPVYIGELEDNVPDSTLLSTTLQ